MGIVHFSNVSAKTWNGIDMTKLRFFVNQTLHPRHQKQDKNSYLSVMLSIVGGLREEASAVCFFAFEHLLNKPKFIEFYIG